MVAVSFGSYATSLFVGDDAAAWWDNVFVTALILTMVAVNLVGATFVARAQSVIVIGVLAVFAVFIAVTITDIDLDLLAFDGYPSFSKIVASVALTFFAYLGFNVITFTAGDLKNPARDLPRATFGALGVTSVTYVLIALGVFGTLTVAEVIQYGETAIAEAARPALGDAGFTIMAVAALLSTAGATNATLYASSNLTGMLAQERLFPPFFGPGTRLGARSGLFITAGLVLVIANLVDLSSIASVGSAVALMIFILDRHRRLPAAGRHREQPSDRPAGHRGDGGRARVLRRRHGAERSRDVHGHHRDRPPRGRSGRRLDADPRPAPTRRSAGRAAPLTA